MPTVAVPAHAAYTPGTGRAWTHYPQLDGLRCLAVVFVIWEHAGPPQQGHSFGDDGVRLFFVLSAFLITGILLRLRDGNATLRSALRVFYARRFLRILPAYYLLLAVAVLLGLATARRDVAWHALYLSNWRFITVPWKPPFNHLWSLSVEEQFYLVWPLVVLCAPLRRLPRIFGGAIALAILTRVSILALHGGWAASQLPTPCSLDALGLGALLAWHRHTAPSAHARRAGVTDRCFLAGGVLLLVAVAASTAVIPYAVRMGIEAPAASLVGLWLVERGVRGVGGLPGALLTARPVRYVGRISYGVYLAQTPVRYGLGVVLHREGLFDGGVGLFLATLALSIAAASLSWYAMEAPLSAWKSRVPYPVGRGNAGSAWRRS